MLCRLYEEKSYDNLSICVLCTKRKADKFYVKTFSLGKQKQICLRNLRSSRVSSNVKQSKSERGMCIQI